ncbi:MAG TPA: hypothetical protein VK718_05475 [Ferruginibacter sp.]|jgi:hypothetical protein|nr:hypothetical protein [Ferruginibacter sp.]
MLFRKIGVCFFLVTGIVCNSSFSNKAIPVKNEGALTFEFDLTATTPLLKPPYISGVMDDPTDPAATIGFIADVKENGKMIAAKEYTVTAISDNKLVVRDNNILISNADGYVTIKIVPTGFGYSNITLTLTRGKNTSSLVINYASSAAADTPSNTFWHTGISDASAVVALDSDYMVIADDEINSLLVFHRYESGLPVAAFNYASLSGLTDGGDGNYKEVDCEAGARSFAHPERTYWSGSMSNGGKHLEEKPNRSCLFETEISGTGAHTKFIYKGHYNDLRKQLLQWGDKNGYKLSSSADYGMTPKSVAGFNIEGIVFAPDSTTLYIGFRAPIVPVTNRTKALIAPIQNFESWFNNGDPSGDPVIGKPIELDLGGRGIRDMLRLSNGNYLIIAGSSDEILNAALYTWTGKPADAPVLSNMMDVYALKIESGLEIFNNGQPTGKVQVISDNGSNVFYNDDVQTKFLHTNFKKFRSDIVDIQQQVNK